MELFSVNASLFWFLLGVVFLVLEAVTPGFFLIFFGLGAWVVSLVLFFTPMGHNIQWLLFIVVSVASLLVFRRKFKALFQGRLAKADNMDDPVINDRYIGREVLIIQEAGPDQPGLAELDGTNWRARSEGPVIPAGRRARVLRLDGLTLVVTPTGNGTD